MASFNNRLLYGFIAILTASTYCIAEIENVGGCLFPCGDGTPKCIHQSDRCDNELDCDNGSDEEEEFCHNSKRTEATYNVIAIKTKSNVSDCELTEYPDTCKRCINNDLYCNNARLTQVPSNIYSNLTKLILMNNSITKVSDEDLANYTSLKTLSLQNNLIREIEPETFSKLTNLQRLYLKNNRLRKLPAGLLHGLHLLYYIDLARNHFGQSCLDLNVFKNMSSMEHIDLSNNKLQFKDESFPEMRNLKYLILDGNEIEDITEELLQNLPALTSLKITRNRIRTVYTRAFDGQKHLVLLDLSYNKIEFLDEGTFRCLTNLQKLYLDGNALTWLAPKLFHPLISLDHLSLKEIDIGNIEKSMFDFDENKLNYIYFKRFHYCHFAPHVPMCDPKTDGVSSMEDLIANPLLRKFVWLVSAFTCIGNAVVVFSRLVTQEDTKEWGILIRNLSGADFLMGIYLLVIALNDREYRGNYNEHANDWMSSQLCIVSGVLAMISSETSVFILCFITMERYVFIVRPYDCYPKLSRGQAIASMTMLWAAGFLVALLPLLFWRTHEFYGSNGMCFPFHIADPFVRGWKYSAFFFLVVNGAGVLLIITTYTHIFYNIRWTRNATPLDGDEKAIAFRFFFIAFTDAICWIPIMALKVMAICGIPISADWYAFMVVLILPINSAINPIIYTFTTARFLLIFRQTLKSVAAIRNGRHSKGGVHAETQQQVKQSCSSYGSDVEGASGEEKQNVDGHVLYNTKNRNSGISEATTTSILSNSFSERNSPTQIACILNESSL